MRPLSQAAVPGGAGRLGRTCAGFALFAGMFVLAIELGRATRPPGTPLALIWPASAVAFLWLMWAGSRLPLVVASTAGIVALTGTVNALTGGSWRTELVLGASSGIGALVSRQIMQRWHARSAVDTWRLRSLSDLSALLVASYVGAAATAVVGVTSLAHPSWQALCLTLAAWILRVGTSTFVFAAVALRVVDTDPSMHRMGRAHRVEALLGGLAMTATYVVVFGAGTARPLAYAMVPLSMWVALRLRTTVAAAHVPLIGVLVVFDTLQGRGPFGALPPLTAAPLAQGFITVIGGVTLVLALHRDERVRLVREAEASHARAEEQARVAGEQAELLQTILAEMDEGIALLDASGRFLVRNRASAELMHGARTPDGEQLDPTRLGLFMPDGTPCTSADMAATRALAGEHVEQDYVLRYADGSRTIAARARPLLTHQGRTQALVVFSDVTRVREAAAEVARARDLFSGVLDAATDLAILSTDVRGRITVFNVGAERLLGYTAAQVLGRTPWFLHDRRELAQRLAELGIDVDDVLGGDVLGGDVLGGNGVPAELALALDQQLLGTRRWTLRTSDGLPVPVLMTSSVMRDPDGAVVGTMSASRDLTAELAAQADLADSEERFRLAFDTAPMGMMMMGLAPGHAGAILRVNPAMSDLVGYDELELLSMNVTDLSHPDDVDRTHELIADHVSGRLARVQVEKRYVHRDGSTVWIRLSTSVVRPHDWEPYSLALIEDITARKQAEAALTHQALHDALTGLPNRSLFTDRLAHALGAAGRTATRVGVLYLDLDGFKTVNDTAGHAAGDELLQHVAERLTRCVRPGDTLARLGGDEFAIVCPMLDAGDVDGIASTANLRTVADRVLGAVAEPIELTSGTFRVGVSVGLAIAESGTLPEVAMQQADEAMYGAKRAGKNRVVAHDSEEQARSARAARVLPELADALARDELIVFGQPVVDLATGHVIAVETLIRWQHPTRGLLNPIDFLDVAESSPLMIPIGRRVLDESCRLAASWAEQLGADAPAVHVNVSARQLHDSQLCDDTLAALSRYGLPGHRLVIELTETHMPMVTHSLLRSLERLRDRGVRIAIDDIGTGYSSLVRLTELPVDILKIDLTFVAGLGIDRRCEAIVRGILSIGQALGLSVVAEGVETPEQADLLSRYGCDTVQGYLYSPPRPEQAILGALSARAVIPRQR